MTDITDAHGFSIPSSDSQTIKSGFRFTTKYALSVSYITKDASCTSTKAYILDSSKSVLYTATFSGNTATFTGANLSNATTYYMATDNNGSSYTRRLNYNDQSYPQNRTNINYTGALDGTNDTLKAFNIVSITTNTTLTTPTGIADRDCFYVNNSGTWVQFQDFGSFNIKKTMNGSSEFEVNLYDIQDAQKVYFKEKAEILFFVGTTKILKGRIQSIDYSTAYECTAKGYGMEVKLLDRDLIKSGDKRVEYDNISAQTIAKEILSLNTDGVSPWIINPGTDGLFSTNYGNTTLRFEYANRLNAIGLLCNAISYEWETYQDATYSTDYLRIKNLLGNQTSVKTFNIDGTNANCSKTEKNIDITNMVNYISCLGYGDGINQIKTSTYSASTIYSVLSSDITATSTSIILTNASSFPSSGTIRIMEERITYTGKSSNTLTGCTRGTSGTTAKSHKINCYVEIYYASSSPQASSSIATYGIMDYTLINRDILDIDTLEVIASGYLLDRMTPIISIKIQSNEPMTDVTAVTMGDMITINDAETGMNALQVRVVGLEYTDDYGEISMEISVSNRSLEFIEQMNKAREDQQNMQKYMQGATNIYALMETTEGDATHYIDNRFYMPNEVTALNKVLVNFKMKAVKSLRILKDQAHCGFSDANINTSWQDVDGASLSVDVGTNDTVLIMASGYSYSTEDTTYMEIRFTRDGNVLTYSTQGDRRDIGSCTYVWMPFSKIMYDNPGAGTFTYKVQAESESGTEDIRGSHFDILVFSEGFVEGTLTNPSVGVYVGEDGGTMNLIGTYTTDQANLDITSACQAIGINKWIDIQFRPNQEMRIEMNAYVKMFLESRE
jgi:hypothetical protein